MIISFWILEILWFGLGFSLGLSGAPVLNSGWLNRPGFGALGGLLVANVYQVVQYEAEVVMVDGSVENFELIGFSR